MDVKKSLPLIIAIILPIIMVIIVVLLVALPGIFGSPDTDFLYGKRSELDIANVNISVSNNRLMIEKPDSLSESNIKLYRYDVKNRVNTPITVQDAMELQVDPQEESPDGYKISPGRSTEGSFPFNIFREDSLSVYLKGNGTGCKIDLELSAGNNLTDIMFIGWIIK